MRHNILKKHSTKSERIVYEVLKETHTPFKHRWMVEKYEVDFLIMNRWVLEIDGHEQNGEKNHILAGAGYIPLHLYNSEVTREKVINLIKKIK